MNVAGCTDFSINMLQNAIRIFYFVAAYC